MNFKNLKRSLYKEERAKQIASHYLDKNRLIPFLIYKKLKASKKCFNCHCTFHKGKPQIHHIIPVSKGGSNDENNLIPLCSYCHKIVHWLIDNNLYSPINKSI